MKTTKTILVSLLAFLMIGSMALMAQTDEKEEKEKKRDRAEIEKAMKARKIAYISAELELTPEEAEKFWPVYNQFEAKRMEATKDVFKHFEKRDEKPETISDAEADKIMKERFNEEQALLDLKIEYHEKYLNILPASKVFKLYEVEINFRRGLMERMGRGYQEKRSGERRDANNAKGGPDKKPYRGRQDCR